MYLNYSIYHVIVYGLSQIINFDMYWWINIATGYAIVLWHYYALAMSLTMPLATSFKQQICYLWIDYCIGYVPLGWLFIEWLSQHAIVYAIRYAIDYEMKFNGKTMTF
jgi:hypothetical protein